jgi:UDP:flavonoid glycosyltransferase YjiC (YdhE family)
MARIVITAWGSYGDLFPYLGLGRALATRGHDVRLAVPAYYRPLVERERLAYAPVGPDINPDDRAIVARVMDPVRGPEVLVREWLMPQLGRSFDQLRDAAAGADLLVTHPVTFAAPVVAHVLRLPWVSTVLAPMSFFSVTDPPVVAPIAHLEWLRRLGPVYGRLVRWMAERATRTWVEPVYRLRRDHGLLDARNPLLDGQFSPTLTLALFSPVLGERQRDWPASTQQTGFVFYNGALEMPAELEAFLAAGTPPVVFTLGSSAVGAAGSFYAESVTAAHRLGVRAVLLTGGFAENEQVKSSPERLLVATAPHQTLFPRAAAVVHHGGVGTTGQSLRAGRPTLVVPHAHDQADNAARVVRLGVARSIPAPAYTAQAVTSALERLLRDPSYASHAEQVAARVMRDGGADAAADAIEAVISAGASSRQQPVAARS